MERATKGGGPSPRSFGKVGYGFGGVDSDSVLTFRGEIEVTDRKERGGGGVSVSVVGALGDEGKSRGQGSGGELKIMDVELPRFE